jgi:hypothetical protein
MKFPYGICDFYDIVTEGYYYADRTDRIPMIEEAGKHLLFLRPRRFGKSLLLSTLENYYDAAKSHEFERLFGHLAVGKQPTPLHNQYAVMNWDFSAVSPQGTPEQIQKSLHNHINGCIEQFIVRYRDILDYDIRMDSEDGLRSFQSVLAAVQSSPYRLYLLIDEYDNFANEVMMGHHSDSRQRYENLLYGEGALKTVFKAVKSATKGLGLGRAFITGVSPVVMSDITSGHNIAKNIAVAPEFNDICGFHEAEIEQVIRHIGTECRLGEEKTGEAIEMMRTFYNGYCFSHDNPGLVYNPTLAIYFMEHFHKRCGYPRRIMDSNLAMDKDKITYISRLPRGEEIIMDALSKNRPVSIPELADRFGVQDMLSPAKDATFMVSLLYYFGVLTFTEKRTVLGKLVFRIPNLVIRKLYVERIQEMLLPEFSDKDEARNTAEHFYQTGDIQPLCDFMERRYFKVFDNRDYRWANELTVKTAFLTLLFSDTFYIMDSETALDRKYADMTMIVRPDMRQYELLDFLIEFKFVELGKHKLDSEKVRNMNVEALAALKPVKKKLEEAGKHLPGYRDALKQIHGDTLKLKVYSVVAVGFERLVWERIDDE